VKLVFLNALLDAIQRLLRTVAAIQADDYDTAEAELVAVHRILTESAEELRAA
jgi:hypothetical protein